MEWCRRVASNNACEASASEQLIVLTNGDNKSDLVISINCLLPQTDIFI